MGSNVENLRTRVESLAKEYHETLGPKEDICSENTKTGHSLNFPHITCTHSTSVCRKMCYGAMPGKPITWTNSLKKYLRVYRYFLSTPPEVVAERIHKEYVRRKMTFLRWNGVGELFPESVAVVSALTKQHSDDVLLVVTRNPKMISLLPRNAKNLYVMFSLDGAAVSKKRKTSVLRRKHPRVFFSFLRQNLNEDTMGARIVFNAQQAKKTLPYDDVTTVCPVDADRIPVKGACAKCRKCFRQDVLNGSQHPGLIKNTQLMVGPFDVFTS